MWGRGGAGQGREMASQGQGRNREGRADSQPGAGQWVGRKGETPTARAEGEGRGEGRAGKGSVGRADGQQGRAVYTTAVLSPAGFRCSWKPFPLYKGGHHASARTPRRAQWADGNTADTGRGRPATSKGLPCLQGRNSQEASPSPQGTGARAPTTSDGAGSLPR